MTRRLAREGPVVSPTQSERMLFIITGALTALAGAGFFAPRPLLRVLFGVTGEDAATLVLARHWSLLVGLVGALLIFAGLHPEMRVPIAIIAAAEKFALAALVFGGPLRRRPALVAVVGADTVMALLYVFFLSRELAVRAVNHNSPFRNSKCLAYPTL